MGQIQQVACLGSSGAKDGFHILSVVQTKGIWDTDSMWHTILIYLQSIWPIGGNDF